MNDREGRAVGLTSATKLRKEVVSLKNCDSLRAFDKLAVAQTIESTKALGIFEATTSTARFDASSSPAALPSLVLLYSEGYAVACRPLKRAFDKLAVAQTIESTKALGIFEATTSIARFDASSSPAALLSLALLGSEEYAVLTCCLGSTRWRLCTIYRQYLVNI